MSTKVEHICDRIASSPVTRCVECTETLEGSPSVEDGAVWPSTKLLRVRGFWHSCSLVRQSLLLSPTYLLSFREKFLYFATF